MQTNNNHFDNYNLDLYYSDINNNGIEDTWNNICNYILNNDDSIISNEIFCLDNLGELYEIGLEVSNKNLKKSRGKYFTPADVANLMSEFLIHYYFNLSDYEKIEYNICDVACGTGKLILTYLDIIGNERAKKLLQDGKLYLYDLDSTALKVCKTAILFKYGKEFTDEIHDIAGNFLSKKIKLPDNSKVISNPPYAAIQQVGLDWQNTQVLNDTRELYSCFMEKIIKESVSSVIITPYSFISGSKFFSLRMILNQCNGEIYSFDNVPGNIFCGRKHGIFNTNTSNSVRAAITVVRKDNSDGFKLFLLIRFKSTERKELLQCKVLENFLPPNRQKISSDTPMYYKCFKELQSLYDCIMEKSEKHTLSELITKEGNYTLSMPNTCRYYTTAFSGIMNRNGKNILYLDEIGA